MNIITKPSTALEQFTQRYVELWQATYQHDPKSEALYDMPSPCITETKGSVVFWCPVAAEGKSLTIVEQVINITLHPDAHYFYQTQYAGDMQAVFNDVSLSLIQVWNDEDFARLEQHLIAHLTMQKKLKRRPSVFIASTNDDTEIISIDNQTGNILLERLIDNKNTLLADNLIEFLAQLKPIAQLDFSSV